MDANSRLPEREELRQTSPWIPTAAIAQKVLACHRQNAGH
jgi:hypothetical protein